LAAGLAEAKDSLASEKNVRFDFGLLDLDPFVAKTTFEVDTVGTRERLRRGRKFDLPEIEIRIAEGDAEDVPAGVFAKAADEANVGFAAGVGEAHGEDFIGSEFVARANTGAMEAEDESVRFLGEHATGGVRAEEDDGDLF